MRRAIAILVGGLAVLWTLYALYTVARFGGAVVMDVDTTSRIMGVRNGDQLHSAIGLTYHGRAGAALVVVELVLVLVALAAAVLGRGRRRFVARVGLVAWTALWLGNGLWLQTRGWSRPVDVALLAAACVVTIVWAGLGAATIRPLPAVHPSREPSP